MIRILALLLLLIQQDPKKSAFEEKLFGRLPDGLTNVRTFFGPAGSWACTAGAMDGKRYVIAGDKRVQPYKEVRAPRFSPDGKILAYVAQQDKFEMVVVGDKEGNRFDSVTDPFLLSDGRVVYSGVTGPRTFVVIGTTHSEFDMATSLVGSPDGNTFAFFAIQGGKTTLVRGDTKTVLDVEKAEHLTFSPDGSLLAYKAAKDGKEFIVLDGKPGPSFTTVGPPMFHSDGKTLLHVAGNAPGESFLRCGTANGPVVDEIVADSIAFGPGGKGVAYIARKNGAACIIVDEKAGPEFDEVYPPAFGPDGKTVAYVAKKGRTVFTVIGDQKTEVKIFEPAGRPFFSPDGSRIAFVLTGTQSVSLWADQEWETVDSIADAVFSPDGRKIAYTCRDGRDIRRKVVELK